MEAPERLENGGEKQRERLCAFSPHYTSISVPVTYRAFACQRALTQQADDQAFLTKGQEHTSMHRARASACATA